MEQATTQVNGPPAGVEATLDFGTSRAVGGIYNYRRVRLNDRALPPESIARAEELLGHELEREGDQAIAVELATMGEPLLRADVWEGIFTTPPLTENFLSATKPNRSSDLVIRDDGVVDFADETTGAGSRLRGVKTYLADLDHTVEPTGLTAGEIFAQVYKRFVELVHKDLRIREPIERIHITFPAKLPPDRRDALLDRVGHIADAVEMKVDEAAAVAGFFLMTRLGADRVLGVESFRARARCPEGYRAWEKPDVWARAGQWHENLLIVDVGGGTTDCALVKVVIADITPASAGTDCPGRFYRLQPEVVASGGRLRLGGDLLTLRIFELLKAKLEIPKPDTHFAGADGNMGKERRALFDRLWEAAEQAKHLGLSAEQPGDVRVRPVDGDGPPHSDGSTLLLPVAQSRITPGRDVVITAVDFERIVGPVVARVAALAAGIAVGGLGVLNGSGEQDAAQSVDHVVLSGGSLLAASLRERIEKSLRSSFDADGLDPTFDVEFDPAFCKTGAAIGGMYLNAASSLAVHPHDSEVVAELQAGKPWFDVNTSRLHVNLAADFLLQRDHVHLSERPLFARGQPLSGPGGSMYAESAVCPLRAVNAVHRYDVPVDIELVELSGADKQPQDGEDLAVDEEKTIWASYTMPNATWARMAAHGVQARFEIDQDERITIILCRGEPRLILKGDKAPLVEDNVPPDGLVRDGVLQHDLYLDIVRPISGLELPPEPLLPGGTKVPDPGIVVPVVGSRLYVAVDEEAEKAGPEARDQQHDFNLILEMPAGHHWLSVDAQGILRTHERRPPCDEVGTPEELLSKPEGTVFRHELGSPSLYDEKLDPFSGRH